MSVVTDYPDYSQHVAQAQQIAATGVPLLHAKNLLESVSSAAVAGGTLRAGASTAVTQHSYLAKVLLKTGSAATVPFAEIQLSWIDSASGEQVGTDSFIVPCSSSPSPFGVYGNGPVKADTVVCNVRNLDPAVALTVSYKTWQMSRVVLRDNWQWINALNAGANVPGFTVVTPVDDESVLGMLGGVTVPASGQNQYLFGMHNGLIQVALDQGGGPWTNVSVLIAAQPNSSYTIDNQVYASVSPPPVFQIAGPRAPLRVILKNTATTAFTATMSLIRAD